MLVYLFSVLTLFLPNLVLAQNQIVTDLHYICYYPGPNLDYETLGVKLSVQEVTRENGQYIAQVSYNVPTTYDGQTLVNVQQTVPNQVIYDCSASSNCNSQIVNIPFTVQIPNIGTYCTPTITLIAQYDDGATLTLTSSCDVSQNAMVQSPCWYTWDIVNIAIPTTSTVAEAITTSSTAAEAAPTASSTGDVASTASTTADASITTTTAQVTATTATTTSGASKTVLQIYPQCTVVPDSQDGYVAISATEVYIEDGEYYADIEYSFPPSYRQYDFVIGFIIDPVYDTLYQSSGSYTFSFTPLAGAKDGQLCVPDIIMQGPYGMTQLVGTASCSNNYATSAGTCFDVAADLVSATSSDIAITSTTAGSSSSSSSVTVDTSSTTVDDNTATTATATGATTTVDVISGTLSGSATTETSTGAGSVTAAATLSVTSRDAIITTTADASTGATQSGTTIKVSATTGSTAITALSGTATTDDASPATTVGLSSTSVVSDDATTTSSSAASELNSTTFSNVVASLSSTRAAAGSTETGSAAVTTSYYANSTGSTGTTAPISGDLLTTRTITLTEGTKVITTTTVCPLTESQSSSGNSVQLVTKEIIITQGTRVYTTTTLCPLTEEKHISSAVATAATNGALSDVGTTRAKSSVAVITIQTSSAPVTDITISQVVSIETSVNPPQAGSAVVAYEPSSPSSAPDSVVAGVNSASQHLSGSAGASGVSEHSLNAAVTSPSSTALTVNPPVPSSAGYPTAGNQLPSGVPVEVAKPSETLLEGSAAVYASNILGSALSVFFAFFLF